MLRTKVLLPFLAVALVAPACSSGDDDDSAATTESTAAAATTVAPSAAAETTTSTTAEPAPSTTTTTTPERTITRPIVLRTECAKRMMTSARWHSAAADSYASSAEWRTRMAAKNANAAERTPRKAQELRAAARKHSAVAKLDGVSARQQARLAKRFERRALALNKRPACHQWLANQPLPRMPLTGEVLNKSVRLPNRPALVVKVDNHVQARPQAGLNDADIVFEEIVEYGTRFAAVFHSRSANPVGPIRSGRTQDIAMLGRLHRPLFAWSGGNANVTNAINSSDLVNLGPGSVPAYFRDGSRNVDYEHTLYSNTDTLWSFAPPGWSQPGPYFRYLKPNEPFGGDPVAGADVQMDAYGIRWAWTPERRGYLRYNSGAPHYTTSGQIIAKNVVILDMQYRPSPADARSPEAQTIGSGQAWVLVDGRVRSGTWKRRSANAPFVLVGRSGKVIELRPGRTWVELAEMGVDGHPSFIPAP